MSRGFHRQGLFKCFKCSNVLEWCWRHPFSWTTHKFHNTSVTVTNLRVGAYPLIIFWLRDEQDIKWFLWKHNFGNKCPCTTYLRQKDNSTKPLEYTQCDSQKMTNSILVIMVYVPMSRSIKCHDKVPPEHGVSFI